MPEFAIREASLLLGVSDDTVRRWVDSGRLPARKSTSSGRLMVDGLDLAQFAQELASDPPDGHAGTVSARNRLPGIVTRVLRDTVMAQVEIQAGPHRFVSLISREAADELRLEPGVLAVAVIKATEVIVESSGSHE